MSDLTGGVCPPPQATSLLKNAQEVLPLVHAFHKAHNELTEWLVAAEQTLQTVESHPDAEQIMDRLEKEVSRRRRRHHTHRAGAQCPLRLLSLPGHDTWRQRAV